MIGWWIVIAAQTPEERGAPNSDRKAAVLANWETSVGGIDWVTKHQGRQGHAAIQQWLPEPLHGQGWRRVAHACQGHPRP